MWKGLCVPGGKTGWILAAAAALIALILLSGQWGSKDMSATDLEARLSDVLSSVEGAGRVRVLVHTNVEGGAISAWSQQNASVIGAILVAEGGGDALVAARLARAASTALGIDQTQIEVFEMGKENAQ